jgi:D-alanyl-D-alanine endopeptidase (penicillin-binding protein 7)
MILNFFSQFILATTLLQVLPVDVGDVERLAQSAQAQNEPPSLYDAFSLPAVQLPQADPVRAPVKVKPYSLGVVTSAVSAIVVDRKTKQVLFQKNIDAPRSIGSMTKLMTAYVFLQTQPDLQRRAKLESKDYRAGGIQHISMDEELTIKDLLYASLISSDNSATAALVRLSGMTNEDFVSKMNVTARSIGMTRTTFVDPTGLSPKNESVVSDLVSMLDLVAQQAIIQDATQRDQFVVTVASGKTYELKSTDALLQSFIHEAPYHIVAGKTGFLPEAGYCLGNIISKEGSGEILVVVLGSETNADRFQDIKSLVVWTYETFKWP